VTCYYPIPQQRGEGIPLLVLAFAASIAVEKYGGNDANYDEDSDACSCHKSSPDPTPETIAPKA
jgi:hypothetical protein